MSRRIVSGIMFIMLLVGILILALNNQPVQAEPKTWIVDDDGPADFHMIQEAINNAEDWDTIFVKAGEYRENVIVQKVVSVIGQDKGSTVVDGVGKGSVFYISGADNVEISGFTIRNGDYGVRVDYSLRDRIRGNVVTNNRLYGALINNSNATVMDGNGISNNGLYGVFLLDSTNIILRNNSFATNPYNFAVDSESLSLPQFIHDIDESNTVNGKPIYYWVNRRDKHVPSNAGLVAVVNSTNIVVKNVNLMMNYYGVLSVNSINSFIEENNISSNACGVYLLNSDFNHIKDNVISNNSIGINNWVGSASNNIVKNTLRNNNGYGILFHGPWEDSNNVTENTIENNWTGIHFGGGSHRNKIYRNTIRKNSIGIFMDFSTLNTFSENVLAYNEVGMTFLKTNLNAVFHNNFINNKAQVNVRNSKDFWDNGYLSGGNYWSDYVGIDVKRGPSQDLPGSDGMGDAPYIIDAGNVDNYPLLNPYGAPSPQTYNLTITTAVGGATNPAPGTYTYTADSSVQVTAIPNANYLFDHWELDSVSVCSANPYSVLMDKNHALKAVFSPIPPPKPPVGGYSSQIEGYTTTEPIAPYLALITILAIGFTTIRRKPTRKTK